MGKKICFATSSGGHLEEISCLKQVERDYDCFLVTEKSDFEIKDFCKDNKYYVSQINRRELLFPIKFLLLLIKTIQILNEENPDVVISTGALAAYPFCIIGKMKGAKVVYIESFARVNEASLTGKLLYRHVDLFIVQWEDMLMKFPRGVLGGGIF